MDRYAYTSIYFSLFCLCGGVFGSVPLGRASLACLGCPCFGWPVCASRVASFSLCCGASLFRCCCSVFCCGCCLFVGCPCGFGACGLARSSCPPSLPLVVSWCFLVQSVFCWSLPPDIWLYRNGPVVIPLVWRVVVDWLLSSLRSWQQRLRLCVGLCSLHHVVGVVHVPLAPSLRYSPSCDPVYPSDTAKAARARLLGLCCFLPPVLLPSRASALSFLAGLRLSPSLRALVLLGFVCPPCGLLSWLVLVAPPVFLVCPLGVACFVVCLVCLFRCVVRPWLVSLFVFLLLVASPHVILDRYARIF